MPSAPITTSACTRVPSDRTSAAPSPSGSAVSTADAKRIVPGDIDELRSAYADFHPEARALLDACEDVTRSALHVREPMPHWSRGAITLLGDAAHPMVPFMAQGACMAVEDAVVLGRALEGATGATVPDALKRYEAARIQRTARVQEGSLANDWLKQGTNADWVYGYDAWATELTEPA